MRVPFLELDRQYRELCEELDAAALRVLASGRYVLGPEVEAFEAEWAAYCGVRHSVGVGNGLEALELVLRAWDIGPGDEVIVPSNTYIASWLAVSAVGATPVPAEPRIATSNIDPARFEAAITPRTRVVMPVHLYGQCAEMTAIVELARDHGLKVLEDAAQAHGATQRARRAGAIGDAGAFSFYPTKNLGAAGDGGAITTDDDTLADRVRLLRNYGSRQKYLHEERGVNSRLDEMQAALLRVRLRHLDRWNTRRTASAAIYIDALSGLSLLTLPEEPDDGSSVWHVFVIQVEDRDRVQARLSEAGIGTLIYYPVPPHLSGAYAGSRRSLGALPRAEALAQTNLGLPLHPHLLDEEQAHVIATLREILG